jgi:hypothetical protein
MKVRFLDHVWSRRQPSADELEDWCGLRRPELLEWLKSFEHGGWTIAAEATGAFEYDTGFAEFAIRIVYSDENMAFLHRLRWD